VLLVAKFNQRYHHSGGALLAALTALGCEATLCEERTRGFDALLRRSLEYRLAAALRAHQPDLVLVFKGRRLDAGLVARLRAHTGARWANWFPDDPHLLDLSVTLSPLYDRFFTHDSSSLPRHAAAGARAHYLPFGVDPDRFAPVTPGEEWRAAVTFVGTRDLERAAAAAVLQPLGFRAWGPGWDGRPVYGEDYVAALSGGTLGLNVHKNFADPPPQQGYGTGANMRVFELAALGRPQLSDAKADIARHFRDRSEIVLYRTLRELDGLVRELLVDPERQEALGAAARRRVLAEHTWRHRMEELLTVTLA
jgi:spore maturation protein CgeB